MALDERLRRHLQRSAVERAFQRQHQLHHVDVRRLRIVTRMEQQPFLQRRQRQQVLQLRVPALQTLDLRLRERQQRQVAGAAATGPGLPDVAHQRRQRRKPARCQIAHIFLREQRRSPRPGSHQRCAIPAIGGERIDLDAMGKRQAGIAAAKRHRLRRRRPVGLAPRRETPEIVEPELRRGKARKLRCRLRIEVSQQSIAKPMVRHRAQLLLDGLERAPERRPTRQGPRKINRPGIKPHRIQAREPAQRARQVHVRKNLLAAMPLEIHQHRSAGATTTPPAPPRNRQHKAGQQHIIDAAVKRRRHPRQQGPRDRSRKPQREMSGAAADITRRIKPARNQ
jgi:hypothetical protein